MQGLGEGCWINSLSSQEEENRVTLRAQQSFWGFLQAVLALPPHLLHRLQPSPHAAYGGCPHEPRLLAFTLGVSLLLGDKLA